MWLPQFLKHLIGKAAVDKTKTMAVQKPEVKSIPLKADQYYPVKHEKKYIFLHHTAGGSAASSIAYWASTPEHIATPYVIDRDGTIYECFDPAFWAYSLGIKGVKEATAIEKATIAIEICSYGQLTKNKEGKYLTYTKKEIPPQNVTELQFRDFDYWESYTPAQITALQSLLKWLVQEFKIPIQEDRKDFWLYRPPATLPPGIWSHTTVRKDKFDIFPQKEIVEVVRGVLKF